MHSIRNLYITLSKYKLSDDGEEEPEEEEKMEDRRRKKMMSNVEGEDDGRISNDDDDLIMTKMMAINQIGDDMVTMTIIRRMRNMIPEISSRSLYRQTQ